MSCFVVSSANSCFAGLIFSNLVKKHKNQLSGLVFNLQHHLSCKIMHIVALPMTISNSIVIAPKSCKL